VPKVRLDLLQPKSLMKLAVRLLRNYNLPEGLSADVVVVVGYRWDAQCLMKRIHESLYLLFFV